VPEIRLLVVTDPVAKARARVAVRGGKVHGYTPTKTANAEWRIRAAFLEQHAGHKPWTGPVKLHVTAWLRMPASTPKKLRATAQPVTRPDADNYLKTVLDASTASPFVDDSQVVLASIAKRYGSNVFPAEWEISLVEESPAVPFMAQPAATPGVEATKDGDSAPAGIRRKLG